MARPWQWKMLGWGLVSGSATSQPSIHNWHACNRRHIPRGVHKIHLRVKSLSTQVLPAECAPWAFCGLVSCVINILQQAVNVLRFQNHHTLTQLHSVGYLDVISILWYMYRNSLPGNGFYFVYTYAGGRKPCNSAFMLWRPGRLIQKSVHILSLGWLPLWRRIHHLSSGNINPLEFFIFFIWSPVYKLIRKILRWNDYK